MGTSEPSALRALASQREITELLQVVLEKVPVLAEPQPEYFI